MSTYLDPTVTSQWVSIWGPCPLLALGIRTISFQCLKIQRWNCLTGFRGGNVVTPRTRTAKSCVASHATANHSILMAGDRHLLHCLWCKNLCETQMRHDKMFWDFHPTARGTLQSDKVWNPGWSTMTQFIDFEGTAWLSRKSGCLKFSSCLGGPECCGEAQPRRPNALLQSVTRILPNAFTGQMLVLALEQSLQTCFPKHSKTKFRALLGSACDVMWHGSTVIQVSRPSRMVSFRWRDHSGNLGYRSPLDHVEACDNDRSCLLYRYWVIGVWKAQSLEVSWSCSDLIMFVGCFCSTPSSFCIVYTILYMILPTYTHIIWIDMLCPFMPFSLKFSYIRFCKRIKDTSLISWLETPTLYADLALWV